MHAVTQNNSPAKEIRNQNLQQVLCAGLTQADPQEIHNSVNTVLLSID